MSDTENALEAERAVSEQLMRVVVPDTIQPEGDFAHTQITTMQAPKSTKILFAILFAIGRQALAADDMQPSCESPAPIKSSTWEGVPELFVELREGLDPETEVSRFEKVFDIKVGHIYKGAIHGFSLTPTPALVGQLRCDPTVVAVEYITWKDYKLRKKRGPASGKLVLRLLVTKRGVVGDVKVVKSSGTPKLDEAAIWEVRHAWLFTPGSKDGDAVDAWVEVPIIFKVDDDSPASKSR